MSNVHLDKCPICESDNIKLYRTCVDHYATGETFNIEQCQECGFKFTQDVPSEEEIGRYYDTKNYISHSDTNEGIINKLYHKVRKRMLRKKAELIESHIHSSFKRVFDFGCGTGFFLNEMEQRKWSTKGVEKNKGARDFATRHFGLEICPVEQMNNFEEQSFSVVTSWHSLEHVEHLNETLRWMRKILVENGAAFIAVPNSNSCDASMYKEMWAAYDVPRHLWHFTPDTMKKVVEKNGFGIESMYPMPFDAFYVSMLSEKYKKSKLAFFKGFFAGLICYIKTLNHPEKSSSIIYVLRKSETLNFRV